MVEARFGPHRLRGLLAVWVLAGLVGGCDARSASDAGASSFGLRDGGADAASPREAGPVRDAQSLDLCATGSCCDGKPVSFEVDYRNCGSCGHLCSGASHICQNGACAAPACSTPCDAGECCGEVCCPAPQVCCLVNVGLKDAGLLNCMVPIQGGLCPPAH